MSSPLQTDNAISSMQQNTELEELSQVVMNIDLIDRMLPIAGSLHDSTSSLHRVPPEIWSDVFRSAYQSQYHKKVFPATFDTLSLSLFNPYGSLNPKNILHVIQHVCHVWREIIQSLPEMWSDIWLHDCWMVPKGAKADLPGFLSSQSRSLSRFLRFSSDRPLRIIISPATPPKTIPNPAALVHHIMLTLAQHSRRWETLYIHDCPEQSVSRALSSSIALLDISAFPLLHNLHYEWWGRDGEDTELELFEQDVDFPLIQSKISALRWLSVGPVCPRLRSLPWSLLEKVMFHHIEFDHCRRILPHLTSAFEIDILWRQPFSDFDEETLAVEDDMVAFALPRLHKLSLADWDFHFFVFMSAPNLSSLRIDFCAEDRMQGILDFISRSSCSIKQFKSSCGLGLSNPRPDHILYPALFSLMPGLEDLEFLIWCYADRRDGERINIFLDALSLGETDRSAEMKCPALQNLDIDFQSLDENPDCLVKLVQEIAIRWAFARRSGGRGLRSVKGIPSPKRFSEKYQSCFQNLRVMENEGLEIVYR